MESLCFSTFFCFIFWGVYTQLHFMELHPAKALCSSCEEAEEITSPQSFHLLPRELCWRAVPRLETPCLLALLPEHWFIRRQAGWPCAYREAPDRAQVAWDGKSKLHSFKTPFWVLMLILAFSTEDQLVTYCVHTLGRYICSSTKTLVVCFVVQSTCLVER